MFSLAAAVAMTTGATAALETYGVWGPPKDRCRLWPPQEIYADIEPRFTPPPPLPRFIYPRATRVRTPLIVCEVPGDPTAVTVCEVRSTQAE